MEKKTTKRKRGHVAKPTVKLGRNGLNPKQLKFCQEYIKDLNGKQAAIRANYAQKNAESQASRMLTYAKVQEEIRRLVQAEAAKFDLDVTEPSLVGELACIAKFRPRWLFKDGEMAELEKMPEAAQAAIASWDDLDLYQGQGEQKHIYGRLRKIRCHSKIDAIKLLGNRLKMWGEETDATGYGEIMLQTIRAAFAAGRRTGESAEKLLARFKEADRLGNGREGVRV